MPGSTAPREPRVVKDYAPLDMEDFVKELSPVNLERWHNVDDGKKNEIWLKYMSCLLNETTKSHWHFVNNSVANEPLPTRNARRTDPQFATGKYGASCVGRSASVRFEDAWHVGKLVQYDSMGRHLVKYEDGTQEWHDVEAEEAEGAFELGPELPKRKRKAPAPPVPVPPRPDDAQRHMRRLQELRETLRPLAEEYKHLVEQVKMPRKRLGKKDREILLLKQGGKCNLCRKPIDEKRELYDADHIIRVADGGSSEHSNFQVLCRVCHGEKTKKEMDFTTDVNYAVRGR